MKREINKRILSLTLIFVLLCGVFAGCSGRMKQLVSGEQTATLASGGTYENVTEEATEPTLATTAEDLNTTFPEDETRLIYDGLEKDPDGSYPYKLAEFTTYYDGSNVTRTANLKVAAEKINDIVIPKGKVFSFNQTVGKRTVTAGYQEAKVINSGEFVDGLGGGVCQVSSTVFRCVLLANTEIVERTCHSLEISYVRLGGDATVQWNSKDFKFKNSLGTAIRLSMSCSGGELTCEVYSKKKVDVGDVEIDITGSGDSYTLTRSVNGEVNYTTHSTYAKPKPKETTTKKKEETTTEKPDEETTEKPTEEQTEDGGDSD